MTSILAKYDRLLVMLPKLCSLSLLSLLSVLWLSLRCKGCCRAVGLWSFVTQADESKATAPPAKSLVSPGKHKTKESEGSGEESGVFASPEKHIEPEDTQAQWRLRLRERRVSDQNTSEEPHPRRRRGSERSRKGSSSSQSSDAREEPASPIIVDTPPPIPKPKVRQQQMFVLRVLIDCWG